VRRSGGVGLQLTKIPMLEGVVLHPNWGIKLFNCKSDVIKGTVDEGIADR
jgi:hypothetical protein